MSDPHSDEFRVMVLRKMLNSPPGFSVSDNETPIEEIICIQGLEADGYISAKFRPGIHGIPNGVFDIRILDKGRTLFSEFESKKTVKGVWKRNQESVLKWVFGIVAAIIGGVTLAILLKHYHLSK